MFGGASYEGGFYEKRCDDLKIRSGKRTFVSCINLEFHVGDFHHPEREISLGNMKINKIISNYALHHLNLEDIKMALEKMDPDCWR